MAASIKIRWSNKAKRRIRNLHVFHSKETTKKYSQEIKRQTKSIVDNPCIGMHTRIMGLRKLYITNTPYYVVYKLMPSVERPEIAEIITIVNARYPKEANNY